MAEINWGLLDRDEPAKVANSLTQGYQQGVDRQNQNALIQNQLRSANTQNQLQQYQLSSAKRSDELQNNLLAELKSANGDPEQIKNALIRAGKPQDAFKLQSDQAQLQKTQAETQKMHLDFTNQAARDLASNPTDDNIKAWAGLAVKNGVMDMEHATALINHVSTMSPLERSQVFAGMGANAEQKLKQFTPDIKPVNLGGATKFIDQNSMTNPGLGNQSFAHTATPDAILSSSTTIRGQNLADARGKEANQLKREEISQKGEKPLTDSQSKAALFGSRMEAANDILSTLEGKGTTKSLPGSNAGFGIGSIVNAVSPAEQQQLNQAKRDFVNATLRRESGAVISPSEFENAEKQYFPQIGEGKEVMAQKKRNREVAIRGVQAEVPKASRGVIDEIIGTTKQKGKTDDFSGLW